MLSAGRMGVPSAASGGGYVENLFGADQTPLSVHQIAHLAGFNVTVIDDQVEQLNAVRFPSARRLVGTAVELLSELTVDPNTYIVIMTRGHSEDMEILRWAVTTTARYIGMIGSQRKVITIFRHLQTEGIRASSLERVHAPIGLDIGAVTPEEIAVSVVAELIPAHRNFQGEVRHMKRTKALEVLSDVS